MEPFLKWAGGKRWLIPKIIGKLPSFNSYYEPFVGSGGLFFALEPPSAVLSDTNPELIHCYRCVRDSCDDVIRVLRTLRPNKKTYYRVRDNLYTKARGPRRAAYFIFLNKTCWNGLYRVNLKGKFNVPVGRANSSVEVFDAEHLKTASRVLRRATLKCCDFGEAIKKAGPHDLVYFDPPYITTHLNNGFIKYNSKLFHHSDELRLARTAHKLAVKKVAVMISNAAHPLIRQQYDGLFYKREIPRLSKIAADPAARAKFKELVITTFPMEL